MHTNRNEPPRIAKWLLSRILRKQDYHAVMGDFGEVYTEICIEKGVFLARLWYLGHIFRCIPSFFMNTYYWGWAMLSNYFKVALRNINREKGYSFINIFGLAVGIACTLLIFLFVWDEINFDKFHQDVDSIFRLNMIFPDYHLGITYGPIAAAIQEELSEIRASTRLYNHTDVVNVNSQSYKEEITFIDDDFFNVFSFPLLYGDPDYVLGQKHSVVLSSELARKYFGDQNPLGEKVSIKLEKEFHDFNISGVVDKIGNNSSIQFSILVPFENILHMSIGEIVCNYWGQNFAPSFFIRLDNPDQKKNIESRILLLQKRYNVPRGADHIYHLQPLKRIHFSPDIRENKQPTSDPLYSFILIGLSLFILFIATVNYVNFSIARSSSRIGEIGIRKVVGANTKKLMIQFTSEAILFAFIGLLLAVVLVVCFLPIFNTLANKELSLIHSLNWKILSGIFLFTIMVGITAGSHPAFYLSQLRPVDVLKGRQRIGKSKFFNSTLVVLQFTISIFLLTSTLTMFKQFCFIQNKNLGFAKDQLVVLRVNSHNSKVIYEQFKNEVVKYSYIMYVTSSSEIPCEDSGYMWLTQYQEHTIPCRFWSVDYDFLKTMGIVTSDGRDFSKLHLTDLDHSIIVNETFINKMNVPDPVGKSVTSMNDGHTVQIIGVIKDFHALSLKTQIDPMIFTLNKKFGTKYIVLRIKPVEIMKTVSLLKKIWKKIVPNLPFDFFFLNEHIDQQYQFEKRWFDIIRYSSILAIFISCMGLFGLAAINTASRTKEIGIRKVLGSSVFGIVFLLTRDLNKWVLLANGISIPIGWYAMNKWLQNYVFHIDIDWLIFLLVGLLVLVIAVLSVSYKAIRAASANPVVSLRYE